MSGGWKNELFMVVPTYTKVLIDPEMGLTFIRERKAFKLAEAPNRNSFARSLDIVQQDAICSFVATPTCYLLVLGLATARLVLRGTRAVFTGTPAVALKHGTAC